MSEREDEDDDTRVGKMKTFVAGVSMDCDDVAGVSVAEVVVTGVVVTAVVVDAVAGVDAVLVVVALAGTAVDDEDGEDRFSSEVVVPLMGRVVPFEVDADDVSRDRLGDLSLVDEMRDVAGNI